MFQIAEVNKAVGAVPQLVDRGFKVIFDKNTKTGQDMSLMLNKETNVAPPIPKRAQVWVPDAYINKDDEERIRKA